MPIIDLKNCIISFIDGFAATGAVNHMSGYTSGATTMTVDGFVGDLPPGNQMVIDGVDGFTVVSTVLTLSNTTSITFTPALTASVADNAVITVGPNVLNIHIGEGNCTWSEKVPREYKLDRGLLYAIRNGDQVPMDVSIQLLYEFLTGTNVDPPSPEDVLKKRGQAAGWVSTDSDPCNPYCINIEILHSPANCPTIEKEKVVLPFFRYEELPHDPKAGTISMTGKCNALQAIVTRVPIS